MSTIPYSPKSARPGQANPSPASRPQPRPVEQPGPADSPFAGLGLPAQLVRTVHAMGYTRPTPIQLQAIPLLQTGRDLMASAATGSGKTAAFLLPILQKMMDTPRGGTRALVLAPTRELAAQILEQFRLLAVGTGLRAASIYGGVAMSPQVEAFRTSVDVLIATPGRLLDHFQYPYARLDKLETLVLDEADRMLDMGFLPDIKRVLDHIPARRQTLLFSATLPEPILQLAQKMLKNPQTLHIEKKVAPAHGITHRVFPVSAELKSHFLVELLRHESPYQVLAFTRTRHRANRLADFLDGRGVSCDRIHGSRSQAQRTEALAKFKAGKVQVLVATDIAARGIDVIDLDMVINFDLPEMAEDYIHRVGRTARAGATGQACTLVAPDEENDLRIIERTLNQKIPRLTLDGFDYRQKTEGRFEVPIAERIAAIRARKKEERARAAAKAERRAQAASTPARPSSSRPTSPHSAPRSFSPGRPGGRTGRS